MNARATPLRWLPPLFLMAVIYGLSSIPGPEVPYFGAWDYAIKKTGHAFGYGLLGVSYYYAFPPGWPRAVRWPLAWVLSLAFAFTDEFHQSFVLGRTSSLRDVGFDVFGATLALIWGGGYARYRAVAKKMEVKGSRTADPARGSGARPTSRKKADQAQVDRPAETASRHADPAEASQADPPGAGSA